LAEQVVQVGQTAVSHQTLTVLVLTVDLVQVNLLQVLVELLTLKALALVYSLDLHQVDLVTTVETQLLALLVAAVAQVGLDNLVVAELWALAESDIFHIEDLELAMA
jgi:hypothetical protein